MIVCDWLIFNCDKFKIIKILNVFILLGIIVNILINVVIINIG